jgi:hypothetical protein
LNCDPSTQRVVIQSLSLSNGATADFRTAGGHAWNNRSVLVVNGALSIDGNSSFNIEDNDLIIKNGGASLAALNGLAMTGFNAGGGYWAGNGIYSSKAASQSQALSAVAVMQPAASGTLDGAAYTASDALFGYSYYGDADFSGGVDGGDYTIIDTNNGLASGALWDQGDFNYDHKVDGSDYSLIDNAFNQQAGAGNAIPAVAVAGGSTKTTFAAAPSASIAATPASNVFNDDILKKDDIPSLAAQIFAGTFN